MRLLLYCLIHSSDGTIDRSVLYCTVVRFSPSNDEEGYHLVEFYMKGVRCEYKCAAFQIGNGPSSW